MQTLLPYDDFKLSALCLTKRLLLNQVEECLMILENLHETERSNGDLNHPIVRCWAGSELQLCDFGLICAESFHRRFGIELVESTERLEWHLDLAEGGEMTKPKWFGNEAVHLEYRGLLRWLDPAHYEKLFPDVATCEPDRFRYPLEVDG